MEKRKCRGLSCLNRKHSPGDPGAHSVPYVWEHKKHLMSFTELTVLQPVLSACTSSLPGIAVLPNIMPSLVQKEKSCLLLLVKMKSYTLAKVEYSF